MRFTFELYDDKEYPWMRCHKVVNVVCDNIDRAGERVRELYTLDDGWYVYQVCRPFDDCELSQPVFDEINGFMFSREAIRRARTWEEIQRWEFDHK